MRDFGFNSLCDEDLVISKEVIGWPVGYKAVCHLLKTRLIDCKGIRAQPSYETKRLLTEHCTQFTFGRRCLDFIPCHAAHLYSEPMPRKSRFVHVILFEYMHPGSGCVSAMNEVDGYIGHPEPPVRMIRALLMYGCTAETGRLWMSTLSGDPTYIFSWLLYLHTIWLSNSILLSITKH